MSDDAAVARRLTAGDPEIIELVRSWIRLAYQPYRSRLAADLEDLEQETLLDLTQAIHKRRFHGQSSFRTYVRAYVVHKCIDKIRALGRRQWLDVEELELPSRAPSPMDELSSSESVKLALRVVEQTPESCRELWQMLAEGMRYREMSQRLGISEGTLRARVLRCRRRALELRGRLLEARPDDQ